MTELLHAATSWQSLLLVVLVFGFAPGFCLRLLVLIYPRSDPRRTELIAELYAVPRIQRPLWVAEQLETALFEGLLHRLAAVLRWAARPYRARVKVGLEAVRGAVLVTVLWVGLGSLLVAVLWVGLGSLLVAVLWVGLVAVLGVGLMAGFRAGFRAGLGAGFSGVGLGAVLGAGLVAGFGAVLGAVLRIGLVAGPAGFVAGFVAVLVGGSSGVGLVAGLAAFVAGFVAVLGAEFGFIQSR